MESINNRSQLFIEEEGQQTTLGSKRKRPDILPTLKPHKRLQIAVLSSQQSEQLEANQTSARRFRDASVLVSHVAVARELRFIPEWLGYSVPENRIPNFHRAAAKFFHRYTRRPTTLRQYELHLLLKLSSSELRHHLEKGLFKLWLRYAGRSSVSVPDRLLHLQSTLKQTWVIRVQKSVGKELLDDECFEEHLAEFLSSRPRRTRALVNNPSQVKFNRRAPRLIQSFAKFIDSSLEPQELTLEVKKDWRQTFSSKSVFSCHQSGNEVLEIGLCFATSLRIHTFWEHNHGATSSDLFTNLQRAASHGANPLFDPCWLFTREDRFHQAIYNLAHLRWEPLERVQRDHLGRPTLSLNPQSLDSSRAALVPEVILRRSHLKRGAIIPLDESVPAASALLNSEDLARQLEKTLTQGILEETSGSCLLHIVLEHSLGHSLQLRLDDRRQHYSFTDVNEGAWSNFDNRKGFFHAFETYIAAVYPNMISAVLETFTPRNI